MSNPFVHSQQDFISTSENHQISEETAAILEDIRFLLLALLKQVDHNPSEQEAAKLISTATWVLDRITSLPDGSASQSTLEADHIYKSARIASLIYCRSIISRSPLSKTCTLQDLNNLWINMWQIKLSRWKEIPGIFLFIILAALPAAQETPHGRFLKSMFKTTSSYISMDYWDLVDASLMGFVRLQRWLRRGEREGGSGGVGDRESLDFMYIYSR